MAIVLMLLLAPTGGEAASHQAGVIIDYGNGAQTWLWVPFASESITMTEILQRSGLDLVLVNSGTWGNAICKIESTGCDPAACRRLCQTTSSDPFWHLLRLDGDTWRMSANGADGVAVHDGDVIALSWSTDVPTLPVVSVEDVASRAGVDASNPPESITTHTIGEMPAAAEDDVWASALAAIGVAAAVAGTLVWRARHDAQVVA